MYLTPLLQIAMARVVWEGETEALPARLLGRQATVVALEYSILLCCSKVAVYSLQPTAF